MRLKTLTKGTLSLLGLVVIVGCSSSSTSPSAQGRVRIMLVDSPAGFDEVNIVVTRVDVRAIGSDSASGWMTVNNDTATYDLLKLTNGVIGDHMLPAGEYTQIRISIGTGSNILIDGVSHSLNVPSATGLKLNHNFTLDDGKLYVLTLDFDATRSVRLANNNQYRLQPVSRVVANVVSGTIYGTIDPIAIQSAITTVIANDTVSTMSQTTDGYFRLVALPAGICDLTITLDDTSYQDTTIMGVEVVAQQDKNIGTVTLSKAQEDTYVDL